MRVDPTEIGTVQDVAGSTVSVALDPGTASGLTFVDGHGYRMGQVGSFVRISFGYTDLFGVVSQVGAGAVPDRLHLEEPYGHRWMTVQLVGESLRGSDFQRGMSQHPTIGDSVYLITERDLARLYGSSDAPECLRVGRIANAESIPALVNVDRLVTRHSAVVGSTGSGKSTTVARLLRAVVDRDRFPSARVLLFDLHGEYAPTLGSQARVFAVGGSRATLPLLVPYWAMSFEELLPVVFGELPDRERAAVQEKVVELKAESLAVKPREGVTVKSLTVDSPVPFSIHKLWFELHRLVNATHTAPPSGQSPATEALEVDGRGIPAEPGDALRVVPPKYLPTQHGTVFLSGSQLALRKPLELLAARLRDPRLAFLFSPGDWAVDLDGSTQADLDSALQGWLGGAEPIAVLDLSGVPSEIVRTLLGVLLRMVYDALFWGRRLSEGGRERPLLVVLEEAHGYLGRESRGVAGQIARRIVREGRKYGVGLMVVSQRPSEIDATVLSQCGTFFALRLNNATDRGHVAGVVSDTMGTFLDALPILRTGEAIVVGESVQLPMRLLVDPLPDAERPDSGDPAVYDPRGPGGWNRSRERDDYAELVKVWRAQNPVPTNLI